jgi:putative membrane protein
MAKAKLKAEKSERLLVLVVDVDNDLYRKTRIGGPLIGRVQNLSAATQLSLADPEDTDANTMFQAVKIYDQLKDDGYSVNIATVTGAESEGYAADREIAAQLDKVLAQAKADACVFVTDGASDERSLPLIESRIKINSVKSITVKQSKALENTYFTILEKLKEPHYARIVFGIPAMLLLLFALSYAAGLGWQLPVGIIGLYLFIKGFGLEDTLLGSFKGFGFSIDRMSFVFYLTSLVFLVAGVFIGASDYVAQLASTGNASLSLVYGIEGLMLLLPFIMLLFLIGRIIDTRSSRYVFRNFRYGVYIGSSLIIWVLLYSFTAWFLGQLYFGQFLLFTVCAIAVGIAISTLASVLRGRVLRTKRLKNRLVVNELGTLIGKVAGIDLKRGSLVINTSFGNPVRYSVDRIVEIANKIVIK